MAIIVENGTGLATAETFVSVADADTYFTNRGNATWAAATTASKEAALRKAADYIDQIYDGRWAGQRKTQTQALSWPRSYVSRELATGSSEIYYDDDAIPARVARACAELAVRALSADLLADQDRVTESEEVGPIKIKYSPGAPPEKKFPAIDAMLSIFFQVTAPASSVRMVRA